MMHRIYKALTTARYNTTATADPELLFEFDANSTYFVSGVLSFQGAANADFKHGFYAGGATLLRGSGFCASQYNAYPTSGPPTPSTVLVSGAWSSAMFMAGTTKTLPLVSGDYWQNMKYSLAFQTLDAGTFSIVWAQYTAAPSDAVYMLAGSTIQYEKLT